MRFTQKTGSCKYPYGAGMDQFDRGCAWCAGITKRQERETELGEVLDLEKRDFLGSRSPSLKLIRTSAVFFPGSDALGISS